MTSTPVDLQPLPAWLAAQGPQVIEVIHASGLDGRGGAAFRTGSKWSLAASEVAPRCIVVCNGDESEPGTLKDRPLSEGDPLAVLEGMALASCAVGASRGYLYVRGEYPRAQRILRQAIDAAHQDGYFGSGILGTEFDLDDAAFTMTETTSCGLGVTARSAIQSARRRWRTSSKEHRMHREWDG